MNETARKRSRRRIWGVTSTIIVAIIFVFAIFLVIFRLFGFEIYTVMSGSMEPTLHTGSLIYVKQVDPATLKEGDIITFVADEDKTIVTHRIYAIEQENGNLMFRTKGDANDTPDGKATHYKNVLGVPSFQIPLIGYLAFYIQRPPGIYIALVAGTLLLAAVIAPTFNRGKEKTASKKEK